MFERHVALDKEVHFQLTPRLTVNHAETLIIDNKILQIYEKFQMFPLCLRHSQIFYTFCADSKYFSQVDAHDE